jgi:AmmeMemoRadiSam system protein B
MPDSPQDTPRGRIILPGAAAETSEAPRIVLPPGVEREPDRELPEYPRLRPLVLVPITDGKREVLLVSDPLGVIQGQPVLSIEALGLIQLLDGSLSLNDLGAALARETKDIRVTQLVRDFVAQLDDLLMLESPRFEAAYRALREDYHRLEIRQAALEGRSYPPRGPELDRFLAAHDAAAEGMRAAAGEPVAAADAVPRALLAPHLDPRRAGAVIARAYFELGDAPKEPLRVVVFGTGHALIGDLFALTRKHFETPLGRVPCDTAFVDAVAATLGDAAWHGELAHRDEHSIEFQALYLRHRLGDHPFTIVPILCGGFHTLLDAGRKPREDAGFEALIAAVREAEAKQGGRTLYVAGVDLSHVGPRFGDPPVDERERAEMEAKDRAALEAARAGGADAWFEAIAAHDDSTRICGFAPTYAMLRCAAPGAGRLLRYEASDEPDATVVTVAAVAWP